MQGDAHTTAALATWPPEGDAAPAEATRRLKRDILGLGDPDPPDRAFLRALRRFLADTAPPWHSDHLCFGAVDSVKLFGRALSAADVSTEASTTTTTPAV